MANRNLTVLNPAGYQEILQAADTLVIPGNQTVAGTLTVSNPITMSGTGASTFEDINAAAALFTGDVTLDSNDQDSISIVLGANGNVTLSGLLSAGSLQINGTTVITDILDEDQLTSDSATALATQQSIKAYVDQIDVTFNLAADVGVTDLFETSETLTFAGTTNEIVTTVSNNQITFSQPDDVTIKQDLTVTRDILLTGKLDFTGSGHANAFLDEDTFVSDSATALASQQSIKAYVDGVTKSFLIRGDVGSDDSVTTGEILTIAGTANQITTTITNNMVTVSLPNDVTIARDLTIERNTQVNNGGTLKFGTTTAVDAILDEDNLQSDSDTSLATQQSIKAYVDNFPEATISAKGYMSANDKNKLDGIETGATADQTDAEIKTAYENNADTNAFTDTLLNKLNGIESGATADQTGAEIKALYEVEANAYNDTKDTKLVGIENNATRDQTGSEIKALYEAETNAFTDAQFTKLAGIETGATADQTDAEIRAAVEAALDSNVFTDADHTKLNGIETAATADQTGAEIKALYELEANAYTDAKDVKLSGIATGAEVNVDTNLSYTASTRELASSTGTNVILPEAVASGDSGLLTGADKQQLTDLSSDLAAKADLVGGKLNTSQLPDLAIVEYKGAVADQTAMLAVSGELGDWVVRNDDGKVYVITGTPTTSASSWTALSYPTAPATNLSYTASTREIASSTGTNTTLPHVVAGGDSGLITGADKTKLDGIATGAEVNVGTDLSYTGSSRELASSTGNNVTLPEVVQSGDSGLMTGAQAAKLAGIAAGAEVNAVNTVNGQTGTVAIACDLTYTAGTRVISSSIGTDATLPIAVAGGDAGLMSGAMVTTLNTLNAAATSITLAADSGTSDPVTLGETLTLAGTTNQITTTVTNNQVQFALPSNVTITGTMTADTLVGDIDGGEYAT